MGRLTYPTPQGPLRVRSLTHLAARERARRFLAQFQTTGETIALTLRVGLILFGALYAVRLVSHSLIDLRWLFGSVSVLSVWLGTRRWIVHLSTPGDQSPWVILGGDPRLSAVRAALGYIGISVVLVGGAALLVRKRVSGLDALTWWACTTLFWVLCCGLASRIHTGRRGARRARHSTTAQDSRRAIDSHRTHTGVHIGFWLVARTMAPQGIQSVGFVALVAIAILPGVSEIEGPRTAGLFGGALFIVILMSFVASLRHAVGRQHAFLLLHGRQVPVGLWRSLAIGQVIALLLFVVIAYAMLGAGNGHWNREASTWLMGALAAEWAVCLALAAHLCSGESDVNLRVFLLQLSALVLLLVVLAKGILAGNLVSPWSVPVVSALCALMAVRRLARAPLALRTSPVQRV
jgi:hypothetical protein